MNRLNQTTKTGSGFFSKMMKDRQGFSLIELTIVVVIVAIGAAIGGFSYRQMLPDLRLKAATRDLKSDMNMARMRAIRENNFVAVAINAGGDGYRVFINDGGVETTLKNVTLPDGVSISDNTFAGDQTQYNSRGLPTVTGQVDLTNDKGKAMGVVLSMLGQVNIVYKDGAVSD